MSSQIDHLLEVRKVSKFYDVKTGLFSKRTIHALNNISLKLRRGKTIAVIGESGCGKSTLAKQILGIENPEHGEIFFNGEKISGFKKRPTHLIKKIQLVFQNPFASLNSYQTVRSILEDPLILHTKLNRSERLEKIREMISKTGLDADHIKRYPHMFSGGQRQRIAIARAAILNPELLVLDEPVSALDLSVQAQILNLLKDLQEEFSLSFLFITHNISIIRFFADEIMVMYLGTCVESGSVNQVLENPEHPYTKVLLSSSTIIDGKKRERIRLQGEIPSLLNPPSGCPFQTRCPRKEKICEETFPALKAANGRKNYCHFPG